MESNIFEKYGYKQLFLNAEKEKGKSVGQIVHVFKNSKSYEEIVDKDISEFDFKNFKEFIAGLLEEGKEITTVQGYISHINNYLDYCNENANLSKDYIMKKIYSEQDGKRKSIKKWLMHLVNEKDYSKEFVSYNELVSLNNKVGNSSESITYQQLTVCWLLFIGLRIDEILSIKARDAKQWSVWYREGIKLPIYISTQVDYIIDNALKQKGTPKKSRTGNEVINEFHSYEYLIRRSSIKDRPTGKAVMQQWMRKVRVSLNKESLAEVNFRKSGMLFFGSEIINGKSIMSFQELKNLVYVPVCEIFQENVETYCYSLNAFFRNKILYDFYMVTLPDVLKREISNLAVEHSMNNNAPEHTFTQPPPKRSIDDKTYWEENTEKGKNGENIILDWLTMKNYTAYLVPDTFGYDVYAQKENDILFIEVKTMHNKSAAINLTKNEYDKAHVERYCRNHWFYIVVWDQGEKNSIAELYIFKNLLHIIGMNDKRDVIFKEENLAANSKSRIFYRDVAIYLDEKVFDMCDYYFKI